MGSAAAKGTRHPPAGRTPPAGTHPQLVRSMGGCRPAGERQQHPQRSRAPPHQMPRQLSPVRKACGEHGDVGQIPILLDIIQPIAQHELVGDVEADVIDRHIDLAAAGLVEQGADLQRAGSARAGCASGSPALPVSMMSSTISTLRPSMGASRSFRMRTTPRRFQAVAIARGGHEVDGVRHGDVAHQVGQEEHAALQHRQQQQILPVVVAADLRAQLGDRAPAACRTESGSSAM